MTSYAYDSLNRLTNVTDFSGRLFSFSYDALGRRTGLTRPNGVNTAYTYDSLSRLLSVLHQAGSSTLDGVAYAYDAAGNRTSKTPLPGNLAYSYNYDPTYQLTQATRSSDGIATEKYTYDAVGDRLTSPGVPYTYDDAHKMLTREGVPYTYDANGSTLSKTNSGGATSYAWDFEKRLTSVTKPDGSVLSFRYDPFGRRISKTSPVGTTTYVYDGDNIIEELNGTTGTLGERYTYGPGIDEPLVGQRQPQIFYYEADGLGSITSLTTPTGSLAATYTYDSFGFMTASTGSATNWFRYTARQFDSDTALYYYRARYYDPQTGRFLSEDPLGVASGPNFYAYVQGNPVNFNDPFGLKKCCDAKLPQDPEASMLARLVYAEATPQGITPDNRQNEMLAIAFTAINRADFLATHPKQQYMFRHNDDSIGGVIVPSEYGSVKPGNNRFDPGATPYNLPPADCDLLKAAINATNNALRNPAADPYNDYGGVFGLRTQGTDEPGGALIRLPGIPGSNNKFYGLNQ